MATAAVGCARTGRSGLIALLGARAPRRRPRRRELASFLGKLVFVSQVVKGGRTYMQGMLAQFKGLVVDWRRGEMPSAAKGGEPRRLWAHPTVTTVGSALRRIQEELASSMGSQAAAVALIPDDHSAAWSSLCRHGLTVGRW